MQSVKHDQKGRWTLYTNGGNQTKTIGRLPKWLNSCPCAPAQSRGAHKPYPAYVYIYIYIFNYKHTYHIYICISVYHVIGYYVNRTETTCTSLQNWFQTHRIFVTWGIARSMSLLPNDAKWCQVMPKLQKHPSMDHPVDSSKATGAACDCEAITGNPGATGNALVSKIWIQFINSNSQ